VGAASGSKVRQLIPERMIHTFQDRIPDGPGGALWLKAANQIQQPVRFVCRRDLPADLLGRLHRPL
jgi:hypothetical protein